MQVAIEISYYPLTPDYEIPIIDFIKGLKSNPDLKVVTNQLSTQISGDYDVAMSAIQAEMKKSLATGPKAAFVMKILNVEIEPGQEVKL